MNINILTLPTAMLFCAFLISLFLSKKNKDELSAVLFTVFGIASILLLAIMLYNDVAIPQEWWKVIALPSALMLLIIAEALEGFGKISYTPEPSKKS